MFYCLQDCYNRIPQSRWFIQKRTVWQFWGLGSQRSRRGQIWFLATTYLLIDGLLRSMCSGGRRGANLSAALSYFTRSAASEFFWPHESQHTTPLCPSPTPGVYSNSCPSSGWCHPAISSSVVPFSSRFQCFPASGSFQMSRFFASGGQSMKFQPQHQSFQWILKTDFLYKGLVWISLQSKGLWRVFSNTTVQKHKFFRAWVPSQSNSHIHTWPLEKP